MKSTQENRKIYRLILDALDKGPSERQQLISYVVSSYSLTAAELKNTSTNGRLNILRSATGIIINEMLASDIMYIHQGKDNVKANDDVFYGSLNYMLCYIISFSLFVAVIVIYRKRAKENSNIAKVRNKKANKVATKRLKQASLLLKQGHSTELYNEILKALWGYLGDKLNIATSELNKEIIGEQLIKKGVQDDVVTSVLDTINECEFARYSQGNTNQEMMVKVFESASDVISKIENSIK